MKAVRRTSALVLAAALTMTTTGAQAGPARAGTGTGMKVMIIAEENHEYGDIIGSPLAPYLRELAGAYGTATRLDAGYPVRCPSLAAYILLTSGRTGGICDDRAPRAHRLHGDNVFHQVTAAGREWRNYAESAPGRCALTNSPDGRYLVRHVPATYYLADRADCERWAVPMGLPRAGALRHDIVTGLPAYSFVSPDACDDMHGAPSCPLDRIAVGDRWLRGWLPAIMSGRDYRAGRLVIVITWDEGTDTGNHIPTLVISPRTRHVASAQRFTHCSTLRTAEELLGLPLLGCARTATSMVPAFHL